MRLDLRYLRKLGISSGDYKALFTALEPDRPAGISQLIYLLSERVKRGRENNLADYRPYAAIDLAYEAPFNQVTPTLVQALASKKLGAKETLEQLHQWGLSEQELFLDATIDGKQAKVLNVPVFYKILIPVVKAYTTIRAAKLYNDRNNNPLFPYRPVKNIPKDRLLCEIVTDMVQTITGNLGYSSVMRSGILHALKYGLALAFPREEWFCERHHHIAEDGTVQSMVFKEGLRYTFPHPTRMFYDPFYPLTSINTDTGTEYAGHWSICKYSDVLDNRKFWNRSQIPYSGQAWWSSGSATNYFKEVYPCALRFPSVESLPNSREERASYYNNTSDRDSSIFLANIYAKIIPKNFDLGQYPYPVWHRFIMANDDTVIWAEPCAYNPLWFFGYDYDDQSAVQSSFALEAIPFQDHLGNILTQMILTAKTNLANVVFYDETMVNSDDVERVQNLGENRYRTLNFIPFDSLKLQRANVDKSQAFHRVDFGHTDVTGLVTTMSSVLNIMERVLQMSAQEVGAAAQHYQSAKEIAVTNNATTNRLAFTGSFIDDGIDAWKTQLFDAAQAYAEPEVLAEVSEDIPDLADLVEEIGFTLVARNRQQRAILKGNKKSLRLNGFARNDNSPYREENMQLAQVIYQTVATISSNQPMFERVGADNVLHLLEEAAMLSGAPASFKLPLDKQSSPSNIQQWVVDQLKQLQQGIMQSVAENIAKPAAQKSAEHEKSITELQQLVKKLEGIYKMVEAQSNKAQADIAKTQLDMDLKKTEFAQDQRRKEEEHDANMRRQMEAAEVDSAVKLEKAEADTEAIRIKARATANAATAKSV